MVTSRSPEARRHPEVEQQISPGKLSLTIGSLRNSALVSNANCAMVICMTGRLAPEELQAIRERRAQARANTAIEGVTLTAAQEALFEQFDAEALPHDVRRRRLILHLSASKLVSAE